MAIYCELPVYKTAYELYLEFTRTRRTLPREERYTIGEALDRAMVDLLVLFYRINSTREKSPLIARARQLVVEIEIRMRVLSDAKALSVRAFTTLFDLSEGVSRQLVNWQRSVSRQTKISDAAVSSPAGGRPESAGSRFGGACHTANSMKKDDPTYSAEETT